MMGAMLVNQDLPVHPHGEWIYISPVFVDEYGREIAHPVRTWRNPHGKRAQRRRSKPWADRRQLRR